LSYCPSYFQHTDKTEKMIKLEAVTMALGGAWCCIVGVHSLAFTHPVHLYSISKATLKSSGRGGTSSQGRGGSIIGEITNARDEGRQEMSPRRAAGSMALHQAASDGDYVEYIDDEDGMKLQPKVEPPFDMKYLPTNIMRQLKHYQAMTGVGGSDTINDLYVRSPDSKTFWYCGKISRCTGTATLEQCVQRQWGMLEEHAARLRNLELGPHFGSLEIWTAPANSELEVAYNRPSLTFQKHDRLETQEEVQQIKKAVKLAEVGFEGEMYQGGEEGFRTERKEDGTALKPEIVGFKEEQPAPFQ
jgi:hypothetical protein